LPVSDTNQSNDTTGQQGQQSQNGPIIPKSPNEALRPERVPEPPKRSKKARSQVVIFLNFLMTIVVLGCAAAVVVYYYAILSYQSPGPLEANTNFIVRNGAGITEIAFNLERNNIISDGRVFRYLTATHLNDGESLKAGEYEIKAHASMNEIMELLKSGKSILYSVSFPEGLSVRQMFNRMNEDQVLEGDLPAVLPAEGSCPAEARRPDLGQARSVAALQVEG
jgi:UPF0755 protein